MSDISLNKRLIFGKLVIACCDENIDVTIYQIKNAVDYGATSIGGVRAFLSLYCDGQDEPAWGLRGE